MLSEDEEAGVSFFPETPEGFDIDLASAEELAIYGFPSRPDERNAPERFELWREICPSGVRTKRPVIEGNTELRHRRSVRPDDLAASADWSGGVIRPNAGQSFAGGGCTFVVPNVTSPNSPYSAVGIWFGIDGGFEATANAPIAQVGIYATVVSGQPTYRAFYEWYPGPPFTIANLSIAPGNTIGISMDVGPGGSTNLKPNQASFLFSCTSQPRVGVVFTAPDGVVMSGSSAEWIVERPIISSPAGSTLADLPHFDDVTIKGSAFGPISRRPVIVSNFGNTPNALILDMVDESASPAKLLAVTTLIANNAITVQRRA